MPASVSLVLSWRAAMITLEGRADIGAEQPRPADGTRPEPLAECVGGFEGTATARIGLVE